MILTEQQVLELIRKRENISLEFKESKNGINRSVYETVCAFLNRHGGTLLLGVNDAGTITGIDPQAIENIKKDFVTSVNNPQKIHPPTYLTIDEFTIQNKIILHIYIPESSQVHRCNGRIYDRNEDGDFDITDNTTLVSQLYHRKQATYSENKIYPHIELHELRKDLIDYSRKLASAWTANHPWTHMDDMEFLQSAQLYQTDPQTRKSGITLAGILLLGTDQLILSALPHHRTDLILRKADLDRYDDRDLVRTNLIESFERIIAFIQKHLPDPFFLENTERISLRDVIFREVASNILIHREYTHAFPAKLIIEFGQVRTENASKPHGFGIMNPITFTPYPKNPVIGAFFREIHRADELGSGVRKLLRYGKAYGNADPEIIEGDVFRMLIKVPEYTTIPKGYELSLQDEENTSGPSRDQVGTKSGPSRDQVEILRSCLKEQSILDLMHVIGRTNRTKFRDQVLKPLLDAGLLEMAIPDKPTSSKQRYVITEKGKEIVQRTQS